MPDPKSRHFPPGTRAHSLALEAAQLVEIFAALHSISRSDAAAFITIGVAYTLAFTAKDENTLALNLDIACRTLRRNATNMFLTREDV